MTVQDMHYDFKKKYNKVDSQQNENLLIPEIDWTLNEAMNLFIKIVAQPRLVSYTGFEKNQRTIDDIRTLVKNNQCSIVSNNTLSLPNDYLHFIKGYTLLSKIGCTTNNNFKKARLFITKHNDLFEENTFTKSSFEWGEVNALFFDGGLKFYTDNTFTIQECCLSYIRKPLYIHNAVNFHSGTYLLPSGIVLTGTQNCELPEHTHSEIVDIAVMLATGELYASDFQTKLAKLNFNKLIQ
jgi:hypothetical protein